MKRFPRRTLFFDFHTMPANPDVGRCFDSDAIAEHFVSIGAEYVVFPARCNLGMAYYDTSIGIRHPALRRDLLKELSDACHRRGLRLGAYINAGLSHEEGLRHRDWLVLPPDGAIYQRNPLDSFFRQMCYNSGYGDHLTAMAQEAMSHCDMDGLFVDCVVTRPCIGIECLDDMEREGVDWRNERELHAYNFRKIRGMMERVAAAVRGVRPDALLYFNGFDYEAQCDLSDYLEFECLPTGGWGYESLPVGARYLRTLGKPVVNMTARFHQSWGDFGGIRTEASLEYDCLYGIANGMATTIGDHFHPRGDINQAVFALEKRIYGRLAKLDRWTDGALPLADMAVVMTKPYPGVRYGNAAGYAAYQREWLAVTAATRMLCEARCQFDVVSHAADWSGYEVLVLPDYTVIDAEMRERIARHLSRGGRVLASGDAGLDEEGTGFVFPDWGVEYLGQSEHEPAFFVNSQAIAHKQPDMPLRFYASGAKVKAADGVAVLAEVVAPYYGRDWDGRHGNVYLPPDKPTGEPAATLAAQVGYVSHKVFSAYHEAAPVPLRQLVVNMLELLHPRPLLRTPGAPSYLRATVTSQEGRRMVHLLAYLPERRLAGCEMIEEPLTVVGLRVELRGDIRLKRAHLAPCGTEVALSLSEDGYWCVDVPRFSGYALVVFEQE